MDFPGQAPTPLFVHTWTRWAGGFDKSGLDGAMSLASLTWPVASTAFYTPVYIPWPYQVERVFWINGTSVTSVNMDFGIYTASGNKIYTTGSTAESGASATQYVTPGTKIVLSPGRYYFALACDSTVAARGGQGSSSGTLPRNRMAGILQQASALPLPATMTGIAATNVCSPLCGVTRLTTGF